MLASLVLVLVISNVIAGLLFRMLRPEGGIHSVPGFLIASLSLELTLLGFVALARSLRSRRQAMPEVPAGRRLPTLLAMGLGAGPLLFLVSAVVQLLLASSLGVRQTQIEDFLWIQGLGRSEFVLLLLVVGVVAPLAEESFFRGYVFRAYLRARGAAWAYPVSAAMFALLHLNVPAALPIFAMGLVLALVFHRGRSVLPCAVAHGFNNTAAFVLVYITRFANT